MNNFVVQLFYKLRKHVSVMTLVALPLNKELFYNFFMKNTIALFQEKVFLTVDVSWLLRLTWKTVYMTHNDLLYFYVFLAFMASFPVKQNAGLFNISAIQHSSYIEYKTNIFTSCKVVISCLQRG